MKKKYNKKNHKVLKIILITFAVSFILFVLFVLLGLYLNDYVKKYREENISMAGVPVTEVSVNEADSTMIIGNLY